MGTHPIFESDFDCLTEMEGRPCHTIYINNINDKVKKVELLRQVYALTSTYGQVIDIMISKAPKLRGQAFVTYKEIADASSAIKRLQGFPFYDKPLKVAFARRESTMITQAKKYQAPKDERAQAKEMNAKLAKKKGAVPTANGEEASATIYVENLPNEANESMLNLLFQQFPGFKKSRPLPSGGKAFIDFAEARQAASAKTALNGFKVTPEKAIQLSF